MVLNVKLLSIFDGKLACKDVNMNLLRFNISATWLRVFAACRKNIGFKSKCPALSVFEIEERVGNILKNARNVAAMMPEHYKKAKSKYKPTLSTTRRRGEDRPYIQPEEIEYGIY